MMSARIPKANGLLFKGYYLKGGIGRVNLRDALLYWLQIKIVSEARPDDRSAKETLSFFEVVLVEDHKLENYQVFGIEDDMYTIVYDLEGETTTVAFPREIVEKLLEDINSNPKYNS